MNEPTKLVTRRDFIKNTGALATVSALAGATLPHVHAAGSDTINVALIGCGGRGTGAADNALSTTSGPIKLVAMADVFEDKLANSYKILEKKHKEQMEVPVDHKFIGFDGYKHAMDLLKPGDMAIFTTPPAFRWVHFKYAIEKKLNVFMEKPVTVDGPTSRRMIELADQASAKNLKVGVGLKSRHARPLQELKQRYQNGELGDLILMRGYRMAGPGGSFSSVPKPADIGELEYQIRRFHSFLWASGGCFSDFYIHIIDHLSWIKNDWPVSAQGVGGRHYKLSPEGIAYIDQNFDTYTVEYTYGDGTKFYFEGRCMTGCANMYSSYMYGTKGMAVASRSGDCGTPSGIYKGKKVDRANAIWESTDKSNPFQNEWDDLMAAIRSDKPFNEVKEGVQGSLVTSMGRMAAHTGQEITFEDMLNCEHEFAPDVDKLTLASAAPLVAGKDGKYPMPTPGVTQKREY